MFSLRARTILSALLVGALLLSACATTPEGGDAQAVKEPIRISDTSFQTLWINNEIAKFVIEEGYGYPVEIIEVTTPVYQQSIARGEIDLHMELWRMNVLDWYNEVTESGQVIDLGETYERSTQGFYVPRYVIEGDPEKGIEPLAPDLVSVFDLPKYKDLFQDPRDPSKGVLVNCISTWQCAQVNRVKLQAYGLMEHYNILEPGAAAALDSAIVGPYKRGEPVLTYYWEPTWLLGQYDMVQLEEPEYTEECWAYVDQVLAGDLAVEDVPPEAGCAYETLGIHHGIHAGLVDRAPDVVEMLDRLFVGTEAMNELAAYMEVEGATAEETALYFFTRYDHWRDWVTDEAEARMDGALSGVEL